MCASDILRTIADNDGNITIKSARAALKELKEASSALRRINFLSNTFSNGNAHLEEIAKISKEALTGKKT